MQLDELKPGTKVFVDVERGGYYFTLSSKILDIEDDTVLLSEPYLEKGQIQELKERDIIHLRAHGDTGRSMFRWACLEWKDIVVQNIKNLKLKMDKEGKSFNRREAFRVEVLIPVEAWTIASSTASGSFKARVVDISVLGIAFHAEKKIEIGEIIKTTLKENEFVIDVSAKIVRATKEGNINIYGCSFINSAPNLQKFINSKQVEYIRKSKTMSKQKR